jgi:hypothetical protein
MEAGVWSEDRELTDTLSPCATRAARACCVAVATL